MPDQQLTPQEAARRVLDAARQKMEVEMAKLLKTEEVGKSLHGLPSQTPSKRAMADGQQVHQQVPTKSIFKLLAAKPVQKAGAPWGFGRPDGVPILSDEEQNKINAHNIRFDARRALADALGLKQPPPDHPKFQVVTGRVMDGMSNDQLRALHAEVTQPIQKAETFIDLTSSSVPGSDSGKKSDTSRYVEVGKPKGNLPADRKERVVEAEGSGGDKSKAAKASKSATPSESNLAKTGMDMDKPPQAPKAAKGTALKPAGVPGDKAGSAPAAPKAPGMAKTEHKGVFAHLNKKVK